MSMWWASVVNAACGDCLARSAIRCCRVEMGSGLGVPGIGPSSGLMARRPLSFGGVPRVGSPASPVVWGAPTPRRPSRRASLPSLGGTPAAPAFRSRGRRARRPRAWSWSPGISGRDEPRRRLGLPGSWGTPASVPCSSTPAGSRTPGPCGVAMRPSVNCTTSAPASRISGLNRTARSLAVYASQPGLPRHRARLASGRWPGFAGRDWLPAGSRRKVSALLTFPFPKLSWRTQMYSICENSNPNAWIAQKLMGHSPAGIFGYSHMLGGFAGGQAEYARVPFADVGTIKVPDGMPDEQVLFLSDIFPTGYMGAEMCDIQPGDVIAVWGCGPVGRFAIASAYLLGAERVIGIDRFEYRLRIARERAKAETINYEEQDVYHTLMEMTGGRGP